MRDKAPSKQIPLDRIQRQLEDVQSRKAARRAALSQRSRRVAGGSYTPNQAQSWNVDAWKPAASVGVALQPALWKEGPSKSRPFRLLPVQQYPVCSGGGQAEIGHFDPIWIQLTDTYTWASWWYNGYGDFSVTAGGSCWANPETYVGTHWYQDACSGQLSSNVTYALAHTENLSHNSDFGDPDYQTWVDDQADVYQTSGSPGFALFSDDWGEGDFLIFGYALLGWATC